MLPLQAFVRLRDRGDTWVLDADIKGFFDNISHDHILESIGSVPGRNLIQGWLKAGFKDKGRFSPTNQGTPQGGVISPLLANIGLHGLEEFTNSIPYRKRSKLGIIRYADDFIITARSKEDIQIAKAKIEEWMKSRNLELSTEKTSIKRIDEGIDFLGFNIRWYGGTAPRDKARRQKGSTLTRPSKDKVLSKCKEIRETIKLLRGQTQEKLITKLNPILRGFANYYSTGVSKDIFSYISHRVWKYLWRWSRRRHPKKSAKWVKKTYFHKKGNRNWVFGCYTKDRRGDLKFLELYDITSTKIRRHTKVKGKASPDDASLKEYWEKRQQKDAKRRWDKDYVSAIRW